MKLLVLGATGATGKLFVSRALGRGHEPTAFGRNEAALAALSSQFPGVPIVRGNVLDRATVERAVAGHDAVVFCVGSGADKASTVRTEGARTTVAAMTKLGVKRLVAMSCLGAGITRQARGFFFDKLVAPLFEKARLEDLNGLEAEIRKSDLQWVIVRPGKMTEEAAKKKCAVSLDGAAITHEVAREDVVLFMLDQLQSDEYVRRPAALGY